jgi:hypothetical protein
MKITKRNLQALIENYLNEYTTDPSAARSWQQYVDKTNASHGGDLGSKVRDGWAELVDLGIIKAEDATFRKWVSWYRTQTEDSTIMSILGKSTGKHVSPQEVLNIYQDLVALHGANDNNVPEGIEVIDNMSEEEAQEQAERFNQALSKQEDEKEKRLIQKGIDWIRDNTGKEARQARRAGRKEKRAGDEEVDDPRIEPADNDLGQSSGNKVTFEGIEFVPNEHSRSELESMAKQLVQKNPKKYAYYIGTYGSGQAYAKDDLRNANPDNPPENIGIAVIPIKDRQLQALTIAVNKSLNESLSRGSLYRQRYRRY